MKLDSRYHTALLNIIVSLVMGGTTVYDVLANTFMQEQVSTCFALLGDANMNWAASMAGRGCEFVYVRHEHCAVSAAMAYSRTTGYVGVASVTCGPGVTQILTALPAAARARIPLVIFAGEAPLSKAWYNQAIDQAPLVQATGAHYHSLHDIPSMPTKIRDAFLQARSQRLPVVIGVPFDLQEQPWKGDDRLPVPSHELLQPSQPLAPHPDELAAAAQVVRQAKRVIVMAGLGAVQADAANACKLLAERAGGLLATSLPARGLFHDDPFYLGVAGGFSSEYCRRMFDEADLVIAVGIALASHNSDAGKLFPASKVLHIDTDPQLINQGRQTSCWQMRCDARLGVEAVLQSLDDAGTKPAWRANSIAGDIRNLPADNEAFDIHDGLLDPRDVVSALEKALPDEWYKVNSSGHCSWFFAHMPRTPQSRFVTIREFGAIGNGISYAMGVATAHPESTVVLFDGDGSLLMHIQELETIKRHNMRILICILNDGAYGSEIHKLRAEGLSDAGAVFGYEELADVANGFAIDATRIDDLATVPAQLAHFNGRGGCALWDFHVSDKVVSPVVRRSHGKPADALNGATIRRQP